MSLCSLMVGDFLEQTGRHGEDGGVLYDLTDLENGADYARGYQEIGRTHDLIDGFNLADFEAWCRDKIAILRRPGVVKVLEGVKDGGTKDG